MHCHKENMRGRVHRRSFEPCGFPPFMKYGLHFLVVAILAGPLSTVRSRGLGVSMGVLAEPCAPDTDLSSATATGPQVQLLNVTSETNNLSNVFNCEDGEFEVDWYGLVDVSSTIVIGSGTNVTIIGQNVLATADDSATSTSGDNASEDSLSDKPHVAELTSELNLPRGLTSGAVGIAPQGMPSATDTSNAFGPIFHVSGGNLTLERFIIRGGFVGTTTSGLNGGAGIYAHDSNVRVARCEFDNNFAESAGGGIYAQESVLVVVDSIFRDCQAGVQAIAGEYDVEGRGGGIHGKDSSVKIDGSLLEGCHASKEGGAIALDVGRMSILNSVFYNNTAGGDNAEEDEEGGRGGDLFLKVCNESFDGLSACGATDSVFVNSHVGDKGGSVTIDDEPPFSSIEFHRCTVANSSAGRAIEEDSRGEGGAFVVGKGATLLLANCTISNNNCGNKGGAITLSSGSDEDQGGTVIMRNSLFQSNNAATDAGGVVYLAEFTKATILGDRNIFESNACGSDGAVFAATSNSAVFVDGGMFFNNNAQNGGVFWSKGEIDIFGGIFTDNMASEAGGVICASYGSTTTLAGGLFRNNEASNGGVITSGKSSDVSVEDGDFTENVAQNDGGVFMVDEGGNIKITGGRFSGNEADYGGFMYKKGGGGVNCTAATILQHKAVDGGAIYAVDGANLIWACDIGNNSAISGPAIYARDSANISLEGMSLFGNTVARGSVIVLVDSQLQTYQVEFSDFSGSSDLTAVQVDERSKYEAEFTSYTGFAGAEAVIFSEGKLHMDDCDFNGTTSSVLVYAEPGSTGVIRNTVLGDSNYAGLTALSNANLACGSEPEVSEAGGMSSVNSSRSPCSTESECLEGSLGVYCQCYEQRSTGTQRCVTGNASHLELTLASKPETTFHPDLVEGGLRLSHKSPKCEIGSLSSANDTGSDKTNGDLASSSVERQHGDCPGGVVWSVDSFLSNIVITNWTIFPSTGILLPGESITLRVAVLPGPDFDGTTNFTFEAVGISPRSTSSTSTSTSMYLVSEDDDDSDRSSSTGHQAQGQGPSLSFNATFYHCAAGSFWNHTVSSAISSEESAETCLLCTDGVEGAIEGVDCSNDGTTKEALPIRPGYWRAAVSEMVVRECSNKDACKGGSEVQSVDEYCNDGYEGILCSVCSSGYGRSSSNQCHQCTARFKGAMYFVLSVAAVLTLVVSALLVVYLVRGGNAVLSTVASTKASVRMLQSRSSKPLSRSGSGVATSFGGFRDGGPTETGLVCGTDDLAGAMVGTRSTLHGDGRCGVDKEGRTRERTSASRGGGQTNTEMREMSSSGSLLPPFIDAISRVRSGATSQQEASIACTCEANAVSNPCGSVTTQRVFNQAYTGPPADGGKGRQNTNEQSPLQATEERGHRANSISTKLTQILAGLPLSKIKIVVVVWQILSAFADVTNVTFPPLYEKFLSIIGVFSLDLGWILSATCLASDIDFFHKLLIVTVGPMILLGMLGITFHFGASPIRRRLGIEKFSILPRMFRRPKEISIAAMINGTRARIVMPTESFGSQQSKPQIAPGTSRTYSRAASEWGLFDTEYSLHSPAEFTLYIQENGNTRSSGKADPGRVAFTPSGLSSRSNGASMCSFRGISKAGPGNKKEPEQNKLWGLFARHTTITLIILYLVYSQVSTVVFQTFACEDFPEIGKRYLLADRRIECDTARSTKYRIYAAVMIFLYPLGIPAAFCYLLVRQRSAINPPMDEDLKTAWGGRHVVREKVNQRNQDQTVAPTSFLWSAYYPNRYYYEVFECLRRLLLTALLVFVPDTTGQVAYGCIFAFISLWAFELQRPHMDGLEIQIYRTGCLVIFFTNFLALLIQAEVAAKDSNSSAVYSLMLILVHTLFVLSIGWNSWTTVKATMSKDPIQGNSLKADIVEEEGASTSRSRRTMAERETLRHDGEDVKIDDAESPSTWPGHGTTPEAPSDRSSRSNTPVQLARL